MGELTFDGGEDKNLVGGGSTEGIFPGGGMSNFSARGRGLPASFPVGKPICIYHSGSLCTDPPSEPQSSNFSVSRGTEKLNKSPQADKKP